MNMQLINRVDEEIEKIVKMIGYSDLSDFRVKKHSNKLKKEIQLKIYDNRFLDTKEILKSRIDFIDRMIEMSPEERIKEFVI